jgi:hypothetical protein
VRRKGLPADGAHSLSSLIVRRRPAEGWTWAANLGHRAHRGGPKSSQMHRKRGCCRAAAVLLLCGLTSGLSANASATAEAVREQMSGDIIDLDPADLAAVAGPTRRLMAALTDHIKLISTEMGALRADKAALAERVTRLEELDCERRQEEIIDGHQVQLQPGARAVLLDGRCERRWLPWP